MANANPPPNTVEVIKREEKGSDVNLAVQMLNDAWLDSYDCALLVSNDSDMTEALRLIRAHHPDKIIGLAAHDQGKRGSFSSQLKEYAHFKKKIRKAHLKRCQLPDKIPNANIMKPQLW